MKALVGLDEKSELRTLNQMHARAGAPPTAPSPARIPSPAPLVGLFLMFEQTPAVSLFVPVSYQSASMDPPRSKDMKRYFEFSFVQGFQEEV